MRAVRFRKYDRLITKAGPEPRLFADASALLAAGTTVRLVPPGLRVQI